MPVVVGQSIFLFGEFVMGDELGKGDLSYHYHIAAAQDCLYSLFVVLLYGWRLVGHIGGNDNKSTCPDGEQKKIWNISKIKNWK